MSGVLALLPEAFRSAGGIQRYGRVLAKALATATPPGGLGLLFLNDRLRDLDARYLGPPPARAAAFGGARLRFALAALRAARAERPAVVFLGHLNFAPLVPLVRRLSPGTSVWCLLYGIEAWRPLPARTRRWLGACDRLSCISAFTRERAADANGLDRERMRLLPGAVDPVWAAAHGDTAPTPCTAPGRPPALLTVTRLRASDAYKGVDLLVEAMPRVLAARSDAHCVVVGDGDDRARLEAKAHSMGLAPAMEFRGRVSEAELAEAYRTCNLLVLPSRGEGFGLAHVEAAWLGRPAIGARDGATPEVVEDGVTGRLVRGDDAAELAGTVLDLLADPARLATMGQAAYDRARRVFGFDVFTARLSDALAEGSARTSRP